MRFAEGFFFFYFWRGIRGCASPALTCARGGRGRQGALPARRRWIPLRSLPFPPQIPGFCPGFIPLSRLCAVSWTSQFSLLLSAVSPAAASAPCGVFSLCFMGCCSLLALILNHLSQSVVGLRGEWDVSTCVRGFGVSLHNSGDSCPLFFFCLVFFFLSLFLFFFWGMLCCDHWLEPLDQPWRMF